MICVHCATPISRDDDGTWYHDVECPEHTPCWRGDLGATPHVDLNAKHHDAIHPRSLNNKGDNMTIGIATDEWLFICDTAKLLLDGEDNSEGDEFEWTCDDAWSTLFGLIERARAIVQRHHDIVASEARENDYWRAIHFPPTDP